MTSTGIVVLKCKSRWMFFLRNKALFAHVVASTGASNPCGPRDKPNSAVTTITRGSRGFLCHGNTAKYTRNCWLEIPRYRAHTSGAVCSSGIFKLVSSTCPGNPKQKNYRATSPPTASLTTSSWFVPPLAIDTKQRRSARGLGYLGKLLDIDENPEMRGSFGGGTTIRLLCKVQPEFRT